MPQPATLEEQLEQKFPRIKWREPLRVASPQGVGLACRFCIARVGLKAPDIPALPQTIHEFHSHMRTYHPVANVTNDGE